MGAGNGGALAIAAAAISVLNSGQILSTVGSTATGAGGPIKITASGGLTVSGNNSTIAASTLSDSDGGDITIDAGSVIVQSTAGANGFLTNARIGTQAGLRQQFQPTRQTGNAGSITVTGGTISLTGGGEITSKSHGGSGNAGSVSVAAGSVYLNGNGTFLEAESAFSFGTTGPVSVTGIQ